MIMARTPSSNLPQTVDTGLPYADYAEVLADIKTRVDAARVRALRAANAELMGVYWHIGRHIGGCLFFCVGGVGVVSWGSGLRSGSEVVP
jgi:hypothetical protein